MLLMELEIVSGYPKYPCEALLKFSSRSNVHYRSRDVVRVLKMSQGSFTESFIRIKHQEVFKIATIIKVSSWSLGRQKDLDGTGVGVGGLVYPYEPSLKV